MNWESKLATVLTAADDSMAKIKERLYTRTDATKGKTSTVPGVRVLGAHQDPPLQCLGARLHADFRFDSAAVRSATPTALPYVPPAYLHATQVTSEDMVNLSSQLLSQAKMISSLHQAVGRLERDRDLHLQRIEGLEDEVRRLGASRASDVSESQLERKLEGLRQELSSELSRLESRVRDPSPHGSSPSLRSASSILQEVNETKRLIWKEYESLRRDSDYMRQRLRRQEDDLLRQISDGQELQRGQEKNAAALQRILSGHQVQTQELDRTRLDTQSLQRDLQQIRTAIGDLQEDVRILEGKVSAHRAKSHRPDHRRSGRSQALSRSASSSSLDDVRSQIRLADISSDDTSYSFGATTEVSRASREKSVTSRNGSSDGVPSDEDLDDLSDSGPELSFSDL